MIFAFGECSNFQYSGYRLMKNNSANAFLSFLIWVIAFPVDPARSQTQDLYRISDRAVQP